MNEIEPDAAFQWPRGNTADRSQLVQQVLQVEFPQAVRGYDREAVDRYLEQVRAVVTELQTPTSPDAAVRHAIEEITDETRDVLLRAQQSAQEMTARAKQRADTLTEQTEREAAETREAAQREAADLRATSRREAEQLWNT